MKDDDETIGMYELLDALEAVIRAADPAKRKTLAQTIDAYWATLRTPRDGLASRRQYAHYLPHAEEEVHVYGPQSAAALDYVLPLGVESDHKRGSAASIGSPERRRVPIAQRGADARSRPAAPALGFFPFRVVG